MNKAMQLGMIIAVILAVLTVVEYIFAVNVDDTAIRFYGLSGAAIAKAALIVWYFMHFGRVFRPEEAH
ncbi:MAG: cytochrome C oxidase subunit IV family protein [Chloroflexi bacterium]|nr:cytochrome C oxidase subunit IV family protein [Chloroflexota bacterium]